MCSVQTLEIIHWNLYGNQAIISEASLITSLHLTNILLSTIINQVSAEKLNQILNTSTKIATIFLYIFLPWRYNLSVNTNNQWNSKLFVQQTMSAGKQLIVKTFVQWIEALFSGFFFLGKEAWWCYFWLTYRVSEAVDAYLNRDKPKHMQ